MDFTKARKELEKKYGDGIVFTGAEDDPAFKTVERWPVGSPSLSYVLGGGIPKGRIIEIYGPEGGGKSTLGAYMAACVQKGGGSVAIVDSEHAIDLDYAETFGLDKRNILINQPSNGEQGLSVVQDMLGQGFDYILVDSVDALTPQAQIDGEYGEHTIGLLARLMGTACRKITHTLGNSTVVFINQIREKVGGYGNPECVTPDTLVDVEFEHNEGEAMKISVGDLFFKAGVDYRQMAAGESVDVSSKNMRIKSYSNSGSVGRARIKKLVRKEDSPVLLVRERNGERWFKASPAHRVYALTDDGMTYVPLRELGPLFVGLDDSGERRTFTVEETGNVEPILDFEIEGTHNYFANGILSHNTTSGGRALKFYSSIRLDIRKIDFLRRGSGDNEEVYGLLSRIKSVKNKTASPMRKAELELHFGSGYQVGKEYIEFAIKYGIVKRGGAWYHIVPDSDTPAEDIPKFKGKEQLSNFLKENPSELNRLKRSVQQIMGIPLDAEADRDYNNSGNNGREDSSSSEETAANESGSSTESTLLGDSEEIARESVQQRTPASPSQG